MALSPEERARRSALAKELHTQVDPETGRRKFGGPQPGSGRPRNKRASEIVAEKAKESADEIVQAFRDALRPNNPANVRIQAGKTWLEIERGERELQLREDRLLEDMSSTDLIDLIAERFAKVQPSLPEATIGEIEVTVDEHP